MLVHPRVVTVTVAMAAARWWSSPDVSQPAGITLSAAGGTGTGSAGNGAPGFTDWLS
jgi:hypothetical protein